MVTVAAPPPITPPAPVFHTVLAGERLYRIFNPVYPGFRHYGPLAMRFDHHIGAGPARTPAPDAERGIYYAAFTLSGCVVEVFGDATRRIERAGRSVARPRLLRDLRLLDLRGSGAMRAGTVAALAKVPDRPVTQAWSRFFYERADLYTAVDGLLFYNAHNDEEALALYERASDALSCPEGDPAFVRPLADPLLLPALLIIANDNNLTIAT